MADKILLLDIYPARELLMPGVTTEIITAKMKNPNHMILSKQDVLAYVEKNPLELLITAGAGNIDQLVEPITDILEHKYE